MIPDQTNMQAEVKRDVNKVRGALENAIMRATDHYAATLRSMREPVERWAQKGLEAVKTRDRLPGERGWPGWTEAGTVLLDGIEDLAQTGKRDRLDNITATIKDIPATTKAEAKKHVEAVRAKIVKEADDAITRVGKDFGKGAAGLLFTRTGITVAAAAALGLYFFRFGGRR